MCRRHEPTHNFGPHALEDLGAVSRWYAQAGSGRAAERRLKGPFVTALRTLPFSHLLVPRAECAAPENALCGSTASSIVSAKLTKPSSPSLAPVKAAMGHRKAICRARPQRCSSKSEIVRRSHHFPDCLHHPTRPHRSPKRINIHPQHPMRRARMQPLHNRRLPRRPKRHE